MKMKQRPFLEGISLIQVHLTPFFSIAFLPTIPNQDFYPTSPTKILHNMVWRVKNKYVFEHQTSWRAVQFSQKWKNSPAHQYSNSHYMAFYSRGKLRREALRDVYVNAMRYLQWSNLCKSALLSPWRAGVNVYSFRGLSFFWSYLRNKEMRSLGWGQPSTAKINRWQSR